MPVSVVVGGQFGSEGKGKVAYYFAQKFGATAVVRVGGTNSGHTVIRGDGKEFIFRMLPTAAIESSVISILPGGSYIDPAILLSEIQKSGKTVKNLKIDPFAVIIDQAMIDKEQQSNLREEIGSTLSGTGEAVITRIKRKEKEISFAKNCPDLSPYIADTKELMRDLLKNKKHIVIEGSQGFGLSLINTPYYPFCTSRDTTAAGFLMETGLSPFDIENVIMVIRAYPIRVSGNSGTLPREIDWDRVTRLSGSSDKLIEYASATGRERRVAEFDADIVQKAIQVNQPNMIVMNHADYVDYGCHDTDKISDSVHNFISEVSAGIGQKIDYIGTGKATLFPVKG